MGKLNYIKMRERLFIIVYLFLSAHATSQTLNIPADGAEWNEATTNLESIRGDVYAKRFEIRDDTIVNTIRFSSLFTTWKSAFYVDGHCHVNFLSVPYQVNTYSGAIRTNEKQQVIFIPKDDTSAYSIYDFSLSLNDTIIWGRPTSLNEYKAIVTCIDSILVEGDYRKRIKLDVYDNLPDEWIEGIGSIYGLLATFYPRPWEKEEILLLCYRDKKIPELVFHDSDCSWCGIITDSYESNLKQIITVQPNLIVDNSIITYFGINKSTMIIYDISGRVIYTRNIFGTGQITLSRQDIPTGISYLIILDENGIIFRKKIIVI